MVIIMKRGSGYPEIDLNLKERNLLHTKWKEPFYYGNRLKATIEYRGGVFLVKTYSRKNVIEEERKFLKYKHANTFAKEYLYKCKY